MFEPGSIWNEVADPILSLAEAIADKVYPNDDAHWREVQAGKSCPAFFVGPLHANITLL